MRLFKEVLIETAEQAEALPDGIVSQSPPLDPDRYPLAAVKVAADLWWSTLGSERSNQHMIGWAALVPIEAAKLRPGHTCNRGCADMPCPKPSPGFRYLTEWQTA